MIYLPPHRSDINESNVAYIVRRSSHIPLKKSYAIIEFTIINMEVSLDGCITRNEVTICYVIAASDLQFILASTAPPRGYLVRNRSKHIVIVWKSRQFTISFL